MNEADLTRLLGDGFVGYRLLFDAIDEAFSIVEVLFDEAGRPVDFQFLDANRAFERETGLGDLIGRTMRGLVPGLEERWFEAYGQVALTGEPMRLEAWAGPLGRALSVHAARVGPPMRRLVVTLLQDVTARHLADAHLKEAKERLSHVLDGSSHGFWDWEFATGHVQFSESWASILGYEVAELEPHLSTWKALVHPDDLEAVTATAQASYRAEPPQYEDEYRLRHKSGRYVWVHVRGKVVERDRDGIALRAAGTCIDITSRREADAALRAALGENEKLVAELREALQKVKTLTGLLPICMHCKKIRGDEGYWERIESYISQHTEALFSHGLCPDCLAKHYPGTE
jgi:PAS domain S-box-containing protein